MDRFLTCGGLLVLVGLSGYIAGRMVFFQQFADPPFHLEPDTRPHVPVVQVEGIREGVVMGHMSGDVRLFWGGDMVLPDGSGAFRLRSDIFLTEEVQVRIPEDMRFVASRKGKKYYPVTSAISERIKPENRMYFRTASDAEEAGFLP